jgi:hypothetical protein
LGAFAAGLRDLLDELAQGSTYWNDEAMGSRDFKDLDEARKTGASTTEAAARNAVHLAKLLRHRDYPAYS